MVERDPNAHVQVKVRMRESLRAPLQAAAEARDVSLNSEIVERLQRSVEREDHDGGRALSDMVEMMATAFRSGLRQGDKTQRNVPADRSLDELARDEWCYATAMHYVWNVLEANMPIRQTSDDPGTQQLHQDIKRTFARINASRAAAREQGGDNE